MTTYTDEFSPDVDTLSNRGIWIKKLLNSYSKVELDSMFERVLDGLDHTDYDERAKYTSVFEAMRQPHIHKYI